MKLDAITTCLAIVVSMAPQASSAFCIDTIHNKQPQREFTFTTTKRVAPVLCAALSNESSSCNEAVAGSTTTTRRKALLRSSSVFLGMLSTTLTLPPENANAASSSYPQEKSDKDKIVKGYKRLDYLLKNWEKETTICNRSDNQYIGCERTPEKVMVYLGYKSTDDPLFRADKTLIRLQDLVPTNDRTGQNEFQDAIDTFLEKSEEGNGMAFISSWGEANPGGGKDRIDLFIERSKKDVVETRDSLATVIRILDLKVD
mmetsp:Transcript_25572/g.37630  ORF Transcript_25572/g.37630 Transcript_25572/m.37630 type:complete len:258 (+) Transcript_25572:62-835(+)|eukprot:CAMPEP_0195507536 /NCGR_PEP_ID=MMETSP0794_2-20130614/967_1 /TAXON_ID=515487 /ORGANISM="Stephanopyxis turris, Strain CCMP 815" /LENGTH=257 /DNA_ID=CAMNT_0040634255 /DNA_START=54 /DNA_END=827 /DNA_ORIENTATION=-